MIDLTALPKDCNCPAEGPHWLHEDLLTFEHNLRLLQNRRNPLAPLAFIQNEELRLHNKRYRMRKLTVDEGEEFVFPAGYSESDYGARMLHVLRDTYGVGGTPASKD